MAKVTKLNYKQIKLDIAAHPKDVAMDKHQISQSTYYRVKNSIGFSDYVLQGRKQNIKYNNKYDRMDYEPTPYRKPVMHLNWLQRLKRKVGVRGE